jgi:hypothetical protein
MIIKCPSNCECPFLFAHSLVITKRLVRVKGVMCQETTVLVVCRECSHWIDGNAVCNCRSLCHDYEGGTTIVINALGMIDSRLEVHH